MFSISKPIVAGLAFALAVQCHVAADEPFTDVELLWVRPAVEAGAPRACSLLLVLTMPRDWVEGDAAVAIFADEAASDTIRPLARAMLAELSAVLEAPLHQVESCPNPPAAPVAQVLGALRALRVETGAGLVVAIGLGSAGPAVLAAMQEDVAASYLGADGPRLTAAIAIGGDGPPAFAMRAPPENQEWMARAPFLCRALASAVPQLRVRACLRGLDAGPPLAQTVH